MDNLDTNPIATRLAGSSSHTTTLHNIAHDPFDLTQISVYNHRAYVGDVSVGLSTNNGRDWVTPRTTATATCQTDQGGDMLSPSHYLDFAPTISNVTPDSAKSLSSYFSNSSIPTAGTSSSEIDRVNPRLLHIDTKTPPSSNGSPPFYSGRASPGSIVSASLNSINVPGSPSAFLIGEKPEAEGEQPILLEKPFNYYHATTSAPVKEGESSGLEEEGEGKGEEDEEGEEEMEVKSSASSTDQASRPDVFAHTVPSPKWSPLPDDLARSTPEIKREEDEPYNLFHEAEAATSAPPDDLPCLGLTGQTEADRKVELNNLLEMAKADSAKDHKSGLGYITQKGDTYKCIECGKTGRRDRLVAHVMFKHLQLKTWACPLCRKGFTTRDALAQHLKAMKVACLCESHITKNNWYEHARKCQACLAIGGGLKIEQGQIVVVRPSTAAQAGPSIPDSPPNETEEKACAPRIQGRRPAVGQNASKKRRALEFDDESGDELEEDTKSKRVKRDRR